MKPRVMQLTYALRMGGAENLALSILKAGQSPACGAGAFDGLMTGLYLPPGILASLAADAAIPWLALEADGIGRPRAIWWLYKAIRDHAISLVHVHAPYLLPVALPAALLARVPLVLTVHSLHSLQTIPWLRQGLRQIAPLLAQTVCVSAPVHEYLAHTLGIAQKHLSIIQNGIDTTLFTPEGHRAATPWSGSGADRASDGQTADTPFVFGNVCRLHEAKDLENLITAFAMVHREYGQARLLLVGDGEERPKLQALIGQLGLEKVVHITGLRTDIPNYLRAMDTFVLSSRHEGMPLAVLEAMACGLPVVSTAVGDIPGLNRNGELVALVWPENSQCLAQKMRELLGDARLRHDLSIQVRNFIQQHYSSSTMVWHYRELYKKTGLAV